MPNNNHRIDYYENEKISPNESNVGHVGAVNPENLEEDHKLKIAKYNLEDIYTDVELDKIDCFKL